MNWLTRKAIGLASLTLKVNQYPDPEKNTIYHISIDQIATGGIKGTHEDRTTDWEVRPHSDHIFGNNDGQSRMVRGAKDADGKVRPNLDVCTKVGRDEDDEKIKKFLKGGILGDGSASDGFIVDNVGDEYGDGEGLFIQNYVVNTDSGYGWAAEHV